MKAQLKAREDGGWKRVEWSLARRPHLHELEVVHGRLIAQNPKVRIAPTLPIPSGAGCMGPNFALADMQSLIP